MKRSLVLALCVCLLASARAEEPLPLTHQGYAFDEPGILIRQRLFGLAHGVSMLAAACLDLPEQSLAIQNTYAAWHAKQAETIAILVRDLSAHHFGKRAAEANWQDLMRALRLKDSIVPSLGSVPLKEACATLAEALTRPRYDFAALLAEADALPASPVPLAPPVPPAAAPTPEPAPPVAQPLAAPAIDVTAAPAAEPVVAPMDTPVVAPAAVLPAPTFDPPAATVTEARPQ